MIGSLVDREVVVEWSQAMSRDQIPCWMKVSPGGGCSRPSPSLSPGISDPAFSQSRWWSACNWPCEKIK